MKLQHLDIGARFEYEGEIFVKTGPITASGERTGQRVIPRYAVLRPMEAIPKKTEATRRMLDEQTVRNAFDSFYRTCSELLKDADRAQLASAREQFLNSLR